MKVHKSPHDHQERIPRSFRLFDAGTSGVHELKQVLGAAVHGQEMENLGRWEWGTGKERGPGTMS